MNQEHCYRVAIHCVHSQEGALRLPCGLQTTTRGLLLSLLLRWGARHPIRGVSSSRRSSSELRAPSESFVPSHAPHVKASCLMGQLHASADTLVWEPESQKPQKGTGSRSSRAVTVAH